MTFLFDPNGWFWRIKSWWFDVVISDSGEFHIEYWDITTA